MQGDLSITSGKYYIETRESLDADMLEVPAPKNFNQEIASDTNMPFSVANSPTLQRPENQEDEAQIRYVPSSQMLYEAKSEILAG